MEKHYDKNKSGFVFNIQHYSVHDGPGIRTMVFLMGCPLRCQWCSNPESQSFSPVLAYNESKCIGIHECIMCMEVCMSGAIKKNGDKIILDRELCNNCLLCTETCPSKALNPYGKLMNVKDVIDIVEGDSLFFTRSEGGMTLSGGEPLSQPEFAVSLLKEAKHRRINTAIETCGHVNWPVLKDACEQLDTVLFDIKCMDSNKHQEYTGVSNELILDNFKKMCTEFPSLNKIVRTPIIPGFNDTEADVLAISDFIKDQPNVTLELLPYHRLGEQ
ncbi:pyruvate formate lyase activating enzyme, partial [Desulfitispora alkaliphila]|uniref:(2S)-3-sulfopropanediol dehydratase activating enzyme n=1 Tax=Desulfitispora alkaliphila TaxID=622674 RepID=UPI003D2566A2